MPKILLDDEVIIKALKGVASEYKTLLDKLINSPNELFLSSHQLPLIYSQLTKEQKEFFKNKYLKNFKIFSSTGKDSLDALNFEDSSTALALLGFYRIAKDNGVFITSKDVSELVSNIGVKVLSPNEALKKENLFEEETPEFIPLVDLAKEYRNLMEEIDNAILQAVAEAKYILGPQVKELEEKIANYVGTKYAVGVASGTDALVISLRALAIKNKKQEYWDKEDLIITTPLTFTATGDAILRAGATPLFVDIDPRTYTIDPNQVEEAIKKYGKKVKGILPVHLYGHPADMTAIMELARKYNLFVVEDCAQSLGAKWEGKQTGSFGDAGAFSFFPTKPLGGFGDGGMITTNDEELYEIMLMLRKHGGKDKYNVEHIGYNSRLDTIQAAVLLVKFKYLNNFIEKRRQIARTYNEAFKDIDWIITPYEHPKAFHVYHQYTIRIVGKDRNRIREYLKEKGIQTMVYYPVPLHQMEVFKRYGVAVFGILKETKKVIKNILSIPVSYRIESFIRELIGK